MRIDLASKAADFICDAFYCQGGMFYAGTNLRLDGCLACPTRGRNGPWTLKHLRGLTNNVRLTPQHIFHQPHEFLARQAKLRG